MIATISIRSLHMEYQLWTRELIFYKEEIRIFEHHLTAILKRNNKNGVPAQVEHFQNQFILQKEVIDYLKHDLQVSERQLAGFVYEMSSDGIENIKMDNHVTEQVPASLLQQHTDCIFVLDESAATELTRNQSPWPAK